MTEIIMAIIPSIILGVLAWVIRAVSKAFKKHDESHALLKDANLYQIKATLLFMYRHAKTEGNKITAHELDVFNDLFTMYTTLGGNGFMMTIRDKINQMEVCMDD